MTEIALKAAGVANRLRLVQIDFADESPEVRRDQLAEEIERAMKPLVPEQRREFLKELAQRFPSWDMHVSLPSAGPAAPVASKTDDRELKDPSFLVGRLIEASKALSDEQKQALAEKLKAAGFVLEGKGGWPEQAAQAVAAELSPGEKLSLDPIRTLELLAILAGIARSLDQLAWNTWKTMAPRSQIRRGVELQKTMARFVAGDQDVPRGQVKTDVEKLRQLTAALISAVGKAGGPFAQKLVQRFDPSEIEAAVGKGGFMSNTDAKCWAKYKEFAASMDAVSIENELLAAIVNWAEPLIKGIGR
ncbi:MAG: hypothetical protein AB7G11_12040 [Phycisphaerales bacterium]